MTNFSKRRLRVPGIVPAILVIAIVSLLAAPAGARRTAKQYSASMTPTVATGGVPVALTVTIMNRSQGAAVLGSANITVPSGFTAISAPIIVSAPAGKTWTASKDGNVIQLRAAGEDEKLSPGQSVGVQFSATPPCTATPTTYTFATAAKASHDFAGRGTLARVGADPTLTVSGCETVVTCPETGPCTGSFGDVDDAPPGQQTASVTIEDGCGGCTLTIEPTPGNFCSTEDLPADCQSASVIKFTFSTSVSGIVTVVLTCDVTDCPPPSPCTECFDFYPVFFTDSEENTESTVVDQIDEFCDDESEIGPPCIDEQNRLENGDLQTTVRLEFFGGIDPRIAK